MTTFALMINDALSLVVAAAGALTVIGVAVRLDASHARKTVADIAAMALRDCPDELRPEVLDGVAEVADRFGLQLTHDELIVLATNAHTDLEAGQ